MRILLVTGTDTGVGKTATTAALAALAASRGEKVAAVKPVQTGVDPEAPGDLAEVARLARVGDLHELARYRQPLSPEAAGRLAGTANHTPTLADAASRIGTLAADRDLVLVEGAGGLLVRHGADGWTLADLAQAIGGEIVLVTSAALGTLNHTALTLEAMDRRGLQLAGGVIIGCWPVRPGLAELCNVTDLAAISALPLGGALPDGLPQRQEFADAVRDHLGPEFGGRFDAATFTRTAQLAVAAWDPDHGDSHG